MNLEEINMIRRHLEFIHEDNEHLSHEQRLTIAIELTQEKDKLYEILKKEEELLK